MTKSQNIQITKLRQELHLQASSAKAKISQSFFKTKKGEYGEGDIFIGVTIPQIRKIANKHAASLDFQDLTSFLNSAIHEERLLALLILVKKFEDAQDIFLQEKVVNFYIQETTLKQVNNWDLVDLTAYKILGVFLLNNDSKAKILYDFSGDKNIWIRRIAIVATLAFIRQNRFEHTLKLAEILLQDSHNLIQKAVGWMLREMGKKDEKILRKFLQKHAAAMPRVCLSYAIEKFSDEDKKYFRKL